MSRSGHAGNFSPCLVVQQEAQQRLLDCATGDVELAHQASGRGGEAADSETGPLLQQPGSDAHQISPKFSTGHLQPEDKHKLQQNSDQWGVVHDGEPLTSAIHAQL